VMRPGTASHLNPLSSRRAPVAAGGRTPLEGCDEWRVPRRATQGFGGMAMQSPNPQASPLSSWDVYRQAHKAIWLGTVEATDERDAIERVAARRG
jgi:hypothetical protein